MKKQERAVEWFRRHLEGICAQSGVSDLRITRFEPKVSEGNLFFVAADLECGESVGPDSLLRLLASQHWFVKIGTGGRIEVLAAPKADEQFAGRKAFGMHFRRDGSYHGG